MRKITKGNVTIKLWDVGGQPRFRSMWERYCRHVQAIVYVVDAADHERIDESSKLLHDLVARPTLHTVPLLVLGNKNDLPHALSTPELKARMRLQVRSRCDLSFQPHGCFGRRLHFPVRVSRRLPRCRSTHLCGRIQCTAVPADRRSMRYFRAGCTRFLSTPERSHL